MAISLQNLDLSVLTAKRLASDSREPRKHWDTDVLQPSQLDGTPRAAMDIGWVSTQIFED